MFSMNSLVVTLVTLCFMGSAAKKLECYNYASSNPYDEPRNGEMNIETCKKSKSCLTFTSTADNIMQGFPKGVYYSCGEDYNDKSCVGDINLNSNGDKFSSSCCSGSLCNQPYGYEQNPTRPPIRTQRPSDTRTTTWHEIPPRPTVAPVPTNKVDPIYTTEINPNPTHKILILPTDSSNRPTKKAVTDTSKSANSFHLFSLFVIVTARLLL